MQQVRDTIAEGSGFRELTVTCWWFFAAALIMAGPPMSIFSTAVSYEGACSAVTVCRKGYKFTTTCDIERQTLGKPVQNDAVLTQAWMGSPRDPDAAAKFFCMLEGLTSMHVLAMRPCVGR